MIDVDQLGVREALIIKRDTRIELPVNPEFNGGVSSVEVDILDYDREVDKRVAVPIRTAIECGFVEEGEAYGKVPSDMLVDELTLRDYQRADLPEILTKLQLKRSCMLNLYTGYGKTVMSIYLARMFSRATMILTYSNKIREQWLDRIGKFLPSARCTTFESLSQDVSPSFCFVMVGIDKLRIEIKKNKDKEYVRGRLKAFRFVIIDEVHDRLCGEKSHNILSYLSPEYLLACSATPDNADKVPLLLNPYFGSPEDYITRVNRKSFAVKRVKTGIKPEYPRGRNGRLLWTDVLKSLAYNTLRQRIIFVHGIRKYTEMGKKVIVLAKFKQELDALAEFCAEEGISHQKVYGSYREEVDREVSVIFGIMSGLGTGFDDTSRQVITLCDDYTNVIQYTGRIRNADKTVVEFIDDTKLFNRHIKGRDNYYLKCLAEIREV